MIHFDKEGTLIGSFAAPQGHGMDVDSKGFAYLGQNTVRKYDTKTGKLVGEIEHTPDTEDGGTFQQEANLPNHTPGGAARVPSPDSFRRLPERADAAVAAATSIPRRGRRPSRPSARSIRRRRR